MKKEEERQRAIWLRLARMGTASAPGAFFASGFRALDEVLGGGFPRGHMVEQIGRASCRERV